MDFGEPISLPSLAHQLRERLSSAQPRPYAALWQGSFRVWIRETQGHFRGSFTHGHDGLGANSTQGQV